MQTHEHYEVLCALAATGQIEEEELAGLKDHLCVCSACRSLLSDCAGIGARVLSREVPRGELRAVPAGMTERFIARARSEGIPLNSAIVAPTSHRQIRPWIAALATAAAIVLVASVAIIRFGLSHGEGSQTPALELQSRYVRAPLSISGKSALLHEIKAPELDAARERVALLNSQLKSNREALDRANYEREQLGKQLSSLEQDKGLLEARGKELASDLANLRNQLDKLSAEKAATEVALLAEENELREARKRLVAQESSLAQQQHLVGVGVQVRDLIVARNLHIIDVYDRDGEGNRQRPFGRIFYTEGKSLIFYAYDLADPRKLNQQISFYAWGESLRGNQPVKRLGIFHNEDANEGRWALSFDDPHVLAKIDSVFVTVEHDQGTVNHPNGRKILFAFLGNKANHP